MSLFDYECYAGSPAYSHTPETDGVLASTGLFFWLNKLFAHIICVSVWICCFLQGGTKSGDRR